MASDLFFRLNNVNIQLSRYELPIVILLGNIGNFANIIVFSRRTLRTNVCSMYFICLSIVHLILLNFHGLPRVIAITTGSDITRTIPAFCKIRSYLFTLAIILSRHAICLISIDRWLVSSAKVALRQMSSLRSARWILGISVTFWLLFSIHPLIGFDSAFWGCSLWPGTVYALFYSLYSIITSLLTLIIMIVFSAMTLLNIRRSTHRIIHPETNVTKNSSSQRTSVVLRNQQHEQRVKRDAQLVRLSILQVLMFVVLNSIWTVYPLVSFLSEKFGNYVYGGDLDAINNFLGNLGMNLMYVYAAATFVLYTLASSTFRKEFSLTCRKIFNTCHEMF